MSSLTVAITKVTETSSGTVLYTASRRLSYGALTIAYSVTGASTSITAVTSTSTSSLQTQITASVSSVSGYSGVTATVTTAASTATATTATAATTTSSTSVIIGGVVGGVGGLALVGAAAWYFTRKSAAPKPLTTSPLPIKVVGAQL